MTIAHALTPNRIGHALAGPPAYRISLFPVMEEEETFGEMVDRLRERRGIPKEKFAELLDVTKKTLNAWLSGRRVHDEIRLIESAREHLDVPLSMLLRKRFNLAPSGEMTDAESAILSDPRLSMEQREALLSVMRTYLGSND